MPQMAKDPAPTHDPFLSNLDTALSAHPVPAEPGGRADEIDGERFGKYLLVGELGFGGMAEVFLAVQRGLEGFVKVVTLKRVLPHLSRSPEFVRMFIDEARLAARLEHANIVRTYEFGEHEGRYYTVMEYLPGEDLVSILKCAKATGQPLPLSVAATIVAHLCNGLHFAHELTDQAGRSLGLVHRDINPSNAIITYAGEVKIIDFGIAKSSANSNQTVAGTIKGKLAYMSPEQILARGVDRRSDVFSLGIVLWELVTGRPLFSRSNESATLYAIMNDPIPRAGRVRADVPEELEAIIATALARTPADRFDSAEEMRVALERFLATEGKIDGHDLARTIEGLFGKARAEAKRSISQTRSLAKNVSLVMKLRTEVGGSVSPTEAVAAATGVPAPPASRPSVAPRTASTTQSRAGRVGVGTMALVLVLTAAGLGYLLTRAPDTPHAATAPVIAPATLEIASTPPGAAIFIGGEPTGLVTPATLTGVGPGDLEVRVELPGHQPSARVLDLKSGARVRHTFELTAEEGRLALGGLPPGASILVEQVAHPAGEVITVPAGRHELRVVVAGETIARQTIDIVAGLQAWELRGRDLVPR